jgi:hypothetical protein
MLQARRLRLHSGNALGPYRHIGGVVHDRGLPPLPYRRWRVE